MKILAPAKINLYLDITGVRPDGTHDIETIFQTVSLYDSLEIQISKSRPGKAAPSFALDVSAPAGAKNGLEGPRNIAWKAAEKFFQKYGVGDACRIRLKKQIPVQAGLGGGSSDAAAVLRACERIYLKGSTPGEKAPLREIAGSLGADVPFFLEGGCAFAAGTGDRLSRLPAPEFWAVLVKPDLGLSTREVYGWYDAHPPQKSLTKQDKIRKMVKLIKLRKPFRDWSGLIYNCFEDVVYTRVPVLRQIKRSLLAHGAENALLSGSGSALFGLVGSRAQGEKLKRAVAGKGLKTWVVQAS